jgi:hypothetical protein
MIGFTGTAISGQVGASLATAMSGTVTISKVEIYLYASYWASGTGTGYHGVHTAPAGQPGTFSSPSARTYDLNWAQGTGKWITLDSQFPVNNWKTGAVPQYKGVVLGVQSNSQVYKGVFHGCDASNPPLLRITYTKVPP